MNTSPSSRGIASVGYWPLVLMTSALFLIAGVVQAQTGGSVRADDAPLLDPRVVPPMNASDLKLPPEGEGAYLDRKIPRPKSMFFGPKGMLMDTPKESGAGKKLEDAHTRKPKQLDKPQRLPEPVPGVRIPQEPLPYQNTWY